MNKYAGKPGIGAIAIFGVAARISRAQKAADFGDGEEWRKGEVSAKSIGKVAFPVAVCPRDAKLLPAPLESPWNKTGLEPCTGRQSDLQGNWNRRLKTEISV